MNQQYLIEQMLALMPEEGIYADYAEGVTLLRSDKPTEHVPVLYKPVLYLSIQGQKISFLGHERYLYEPMNFLAISVPLPMEGYVSQASPEHPYLAIKIEIEPHMIRELLLQLPNYQTQRPSVRGVCVCAMPEEMQRVAARLLDCLGDTNKAAVLAPMVIKEALFYALLGPQGAQLTAFTAQGQQYVKINKVIRYIHQHFTEQLNVGRLAELAGMSVSSLHQHFNAITNTSPLQYLKAVRLHQAHQLISHTQLRISEAAFQVGYESVSQFSREYKRMFGFQPSQHAGLKQ